MTIEIHQDKAYFIYPGIIEAGEALVRLKSLNPHIVSRRGYMNALVVDLRRVQPMGEG